eukprot:4468892-Pleurochrysis_carterae.AAC.1
MEYMGGGCRYGHMGEQKLCAASEFARGGVWDGTAAPRSRADGHEGVAVRALKRIEAEGVCLGRVHV